MTYAKRTASRCEIGTQDKIEGSAKTLAARSRKGPEKRWETPDWKPKAIAIRSRAKPKRRSARSRRCSVSKRARFALRGDLPKGTSRGMFKLLLSECLLVEPWSLFSARRRGVRASPLIRTSRPAAIQSKLDSCRRCTSWRVTPHSGRRSLRVS